MFTNLNIVPALSGEHIQLNFSWRWNYREGQPLPSCKVFCCTIPEERLLSESVFSQEEILHWIHGNMVKILDPVNRTDHIEAFCNNFANNGKCQLATYQLNSGGTLISNQQMLVNAVGADNVFLICAYGGSTFEARVVAVNTQEQIEYDIVKPGLKLPFLSKKSASKLKIKGEGYGRKKRVMVTLYKGEEVYSVLPDGNEFTVDEKLKKEDIKRIVYLSALIGD